MKKIAVIGSINVDIVVEAERRPRQGETIFGESFSVHAGGKGANQAVAAAKLGGDVSMFGCVGDDAYGKEMIRNLMKNGVDTRKIDTCEKVSTGMANIIVAENDNSIIVIKGANGCVDKSYVKKIHKDLFASDYVLLQHEIPMETVKYVIEECNKLGIVSILNPSPFQILDDDTIGRIDYLILNEHEATEMFKEYESIEKMLIHYPKKMLVTLGEKGTIFYDGKKLVQIPAIKDASVIDTTGAGDTFSGAFVKALAEDAPLDKAVEFAQYASGLSVEKLGAQDGMPTYEEVMKRMKEERGGLKK